MKSTKYVIIQVALLLGILVLTILIYRSIMRPEKLKEIYEARVDEVVLKLKDIRTLQAFYKSEKGQYAQSFDQLKDFWNNGKMTVVVKEGSVPDTLTEDQALKKGIIRRDTIVVDAKSEMQKSLPKFNVNSFDIIPYSGGEKFALAADSIKRGNILVFVYQVVAERKQYLKKMDEDLRITSAFLGGLLYSGMQQEFLGQNYDYREDLKDIVLGSLAEPSTDGNWEK
jgi:hypothetical protein